MQLRIHPKMGNLGIMLGQTQNLVLKILWDIKFQVGLATALTHSNM